MVGGACEKSCGYRGLEEDVEDGNESKEDIKQRGAKAAFEGKDAKSELEFYEDIRNEIIVEPKDTFGKELIAELKEGLVTEFREELTKELPKEVAKELTNSLTKELEEEVKEGLVIDFKKTFKNEIKTELARELKKEVKRELVEGLKKELTEELKRNILFELRAELNGTLKVEHSKDGLEIKGVEAVAAHEANQGIAKANLADEQKSSVKGVGHGTPEEEMKPASVGKEELMLGVPEGKEVDRKGVVDDDEQGESAGIAESCSNMRT